MNFWEFATVDLLGITSFTTVWEAPANNLLSVYPKPPVRLTHTHPILYSRILMIIHTHTHPAPNLSDIHTNPYSYRCKPSHSGRILSGAAAIGHRLPALLPPGGAEQVRGHPQVSNRKNHLQFLVPGLY